MVERSGDDLRAALVAMRRDLLDAMRRDGPEPGYLAQLAGIAAALAALDIENRTLADA